MSSQLSPDNPDSMIESRSIDVVPLAERHGKVWHQGPFWFAGNFVLTTLVVGFTGPTMGLSLGFSILAIVLGVGFGTFFMAFHANQGPTMGLAQMIQSRAQFGSRGVLLPFIATVFVYVGFLVFDTILVTQGIGIFPEATWFWYPVIIAISIIIAVIGHDLLHLIQRWMTYVLMAVFVVITVFAFIHFPNAAIDADAAVNTAGWTASGFLVQFSLSAGYNISYSVYVSDYTRYLPPKSSAPKLIGSVYAGAGLSAVWLMSLGALLATYIPNADPISTLRDVGDMIFPGFGTIAVLVSSVALVSIMGVNAYGAMLTGASAIDGFKPMKPTVRLRVVSLILVGIVTLVIALAIPDDYLDSFNSFVGLMLYFLIPWTAVNLVDFYLVRRGRYALLDIVHGDGIYGRWAWKGLTAYAAGFIAMIPFFSLSFFTGPIAARLDGADMSFAIGLLVSGLIYLVLSRGQSSKQEEEQAIKRSAEEFGLDDSH
ncbi:purine-cytosine permease family protein [Brevibacterium aurantiacum]|uniref:Cytosine/purine/uracil/thiamine/allantoin permease family protein n=1 Tax=Brevibacterium aurantiacum TaxID=273384 RepID=A0A1D7W5U3_BREAU|nr:Cytosine/purine/uracil/thiamine/allantoin permease family protein [Brevibacterium aurantiacum]RCT00005.1 cytosine permease [Brevibacterium aurantiacum]